jgi:hypothetical protein
LNFFNFFSGGYAENRTAAVGRGALKKVGLVKIPPIKNYHIIIVKPHLGVPL